MGETEVAAELDRLVAAARAEGMRESDSDNLEAIVRKAYGLGICVPPGGVDDIARGLRTQVSDALDDSIDKCARCKVCDNQLDAVMKAVDSALRQAYAAGLSSPLTGADFTDGAYDGEEFCGCGEPITYFEGEWMHIVSEELRGTGDHTAEPAGGFYIPDGMREEE